MGRSQTTPSNEVTILINDYHAPDVQALLKRAKHIHSKDDHMIAGCTNYWNVDHEALSAYIDAHGGGMQRNKVYNDSKKLVLEITQHDTEHKST